jgi:hypothetical protein
MVTQIARELVNYKSMCSKFKYGFTVTAVYPHILGVKGDSHFVEKSIHLPPCLLFKIYYSFHSIEQCKSFSITMGC